MGVPRRCVVADPAPSGQPDPFADPIALEIGTRGLKPGVVAWLRGAGLWRGVGIEKGVAHSYA